MKKNRFEKTVIVLFIVVTIVPSLFWIGFANERTSILDEKRELTVFPTEVNNTYFNNIVNWYVDNAPFRNELITLYQRYYSKLNKLYIYNVKPFLSSITKPKWAKYDAYLAPQVENNVIFGKDDWLFYTGDESELFYDGSNVLTEDEMYQYSELLNELNEKCINRGISLAVLIAPNKENVYEEKMPSYYVCDDKREDILVKYIKKNSNINIFYPIKELKEAKKYAPTYLKQDTHWNEFGGLVALNQIHKIFNKEYINYNDVNLEECVKYGGDLSGMCGYYSNYSDVSVKYKPEIFLDLIKTNDNNSIEKYVSTSLNSENLVLIGDSYRDNIKKLIAKDYKETYVFHRSYADTDECKQAINNLKEGDKMVILIVERYDEKLINITNTLLEYFD